MAFDTNPIFDPEANEDYILGPCYIPEPIVNLDFDQDHIVDPNLGQDHIIDPGGEIVLVVGEISPLRIQVSFKVLCMASKIFKSMLSYHFREGRQFIALCGKSVVDIALPKDHKAAFLLLCKLLHFKSIKRTPSVGLLCQLAILSDKYDCAQALQYASKIWLNDHAASAQTPGYEKLLGLTYKFDDPVQFQAFSCQLIVEHEGSFDDLFLDDGLAFLPDCLRVQLSNVRLNAIEGLHTKLRKLFRTIIGFNACIFINKKNHKRTSCVEERMTAYLDDFSEDGLWPIGPGTDFPYVMSRLRKFEATSWPGARKFKQCHACKFLLEGRMATIRRAARTCVEGLCLDCVKRGGYMPGAVCRLPHAIEPNFFGPR